MKSYDERKMADEMVANTMSLSSSSSSFARTAAGTTTGTTTTGSSKAPPPLRKDDDDEDGHNDGDDDDDDSDEEFCRMVDEYQSPSATKSVTTAKGVGGGGGGVGCGRGRRRKVEDTIPDHNHAFYAAERVHQAHGGRKRTPVGYLTTRT